MTWELAGKIEHSVARIITKQEINGWKFDLPLAKQRVEFLTNERQRLYDSIRGDLGYDCVRGKVEVTKPFRKDGTYSERVRKYWLAEVEKVQGPYTPVWYEEPNLGSRQKLQVHLERLGWKPIFFTDKGNPQIEEESLGLLQGGLGKSLASWFIFSHRQSQIQGWIDRVRGDGRITAGAITNGTPTGRMRHTVVVNVPKANHAKDGTLLYYPDGNVIFGTEMRELFIAEDGYRLVGYDAKGLELRILAHYMNDPEFTEVLLNDDIHGYNQRKAGLPTRDNAKTFIYAFIYGAQDTKIGSIVGGTAKDGRLLRERFLGGLPRLGQLIERVKHRAGTGFLQGLDGRRMPVRKEHAALNTLIQGGGAIVMKMTMIQLDKMAKGLNHRKVGDFHDEGQHEVLDSHTELFSEYAVKAVSEAGKFFNLRCPLDGEVKVGSNWAMTH